MIFHVRRHHINKSVQVHEKRSFPKDCEEYTMKPHVRQAFSVLEQKMQIQKEKSAAALCET
jgi:hypothetical protein